MRTNSVFDIGQTFDVVSNDLNLCDRISELIMEALSTSIKPLVSRFKVMLGSSFKIED